MERGALAEQQKKKLFWGLVVFCIAAGIGLTFFDLGWVGWALFGLSWCIRWWRICVPVAVLLLISWCLGRFASLDSAWISYPGMAAALIGGVLWHRASRRIAPELAK